MTIKPVYNRVICLVLDGVGIGELPDAPAHGDAGAHTLASTARKVGGLRLPALEKLGLGRIAPIEGVAGVAEPRASYGKAAERAPAKDSMTGHWELMGCTAQQAPAVFPDGFPAEIVEAFCKEAGIDGVLGNCAASGTDIIERLGPEHLATKLPILYTSVDSVFQVAAHMDCIPVERLYEICRAARKVCDAHNIGRVIARPFEGKPGSFQRNYQRKDFTLLPPEATVLDLLQEKGIPVIGVGKIEDLFAGRGVTRAIHTEGDRDGMAATAGLLLEVDRGFLFTNLVDLDTVYGHRRDAEGFAAALAAFDEDLDALLERVQPGDLLIVTADHGNDPTFAGSTDHTREYVPVLVYDPQRPRGRDLGTRKTFADVGATVADAFGLKAKGTSMLPIL